MDKIKTILTSYRQISLEPVFFLFCVNLGLIGIASQALYLEKACKVNLNQTEAICDNIYNHTETQKETQKYVSGIQAYNGMLQVRSEIIITDISLITETSERSRDCLHSVCRTPD